MAYYSDGRINRNSIHSENNKYEGIGQSTKGAFSMGLLAKVDVDFTAA